MHNACVSVHKLNFIWPIQCVAAQAVFVPELCPPDFPSTAPNSVSTNATETLIPVELARPVASSVLQQVQLDAA